MRCPECGAPGYSRKTKTPKFRCRDPKCGFEWDDAILESRLDEQAVESRLEEQRRRNDQGAAWGAGCAFLGLFIGLGIGRALSDSAQGSILGGLLLGVIGYVVGKNWRDWTS